MILGVVLLCGLVAVMVPFTVKQSKDKSLEVFFLHFTKNIQLPVTLTYFKQKSKHQYLEVKKARTIFLPNLGEQIRLPP